MSVANSIGADIYDLFKDKADKILSDIEVMAKEAGEGAVATTGESGTSRRERVRRARERAAKRRESNPEGIDFDSYLKDHPEMETREFNHIQFERIQMRFAEEREELAERYAQAIDRLEDQIKVQEDQADEQQLLLAQRQAKRIKQLVEIAKSGKKISI